jgi:hypothetical protein
MINQFHHNIELSVIGPGGEDLYNIGMVYGGGHARLLLQSRGVVAFPLRSLRNSFSATRTIKERVTRLINRAHAANAKRLEQYEMIERPFRPRFLTAIRTGTRASGSASAVSTPCRRLGMSVSL